MRRSVVITKATTPAAVDNGSVGLTGVAGALSAGSVGVSGAAWNLPATISVQQDGTVGLRQYALNAGAHTISVSGLPAGVTYNAGLEQLEGASTGTASATVTFTLTLGAITVQTTATVSLVSGYDLAAAIAAVPFTVNLPTAPTITSEATCSSAAEISASLAVNGRRTIIAAGTYSMSSFSVGGSDKSIEFEPGVTINVTGGVSVSGSRIAFIGDEASPAVINNGTGTTLSGGIADIRFERVIVNTTATFNSFLISDVGASPVARLLLLSSRFYTATDALIFLGGNAATNDLVIANTALETDSTTTGWAIRFTRGNNRLVIMDSFIRSDLSGQSMLRFEQTYETNTNWYVARNQLEARQDELGNAIAVMIRETADVPGSQIDLDGGWFIDNEIYGGVEIRFDYPLIRNFTAYGNNGYLVAGPFGQTWQWDRDAGNWNIGVNPVTYGWTGTKPTWVMQ